MNTQSSNLSGRKIVSLKCGCLGGVCWSVHCVLSLSVDVPAIVDLPLHMIGDQLKAALFGASPPSSRAVPVLE